MIAVITLFEYIFVAWTVIRLFSYSLWSFKNKNYAGGIALCALCIAALVLFVMTELDAFR